VVVNPDDPKEIRKRIRKLKKKQPTFRDIEQLQKGDDKNHAHKWYYPLVRIYHPQVRGREGG
jgi:hypothetical protein